MRIAHHLVALLLAAGLGVLLQESEAQDTRIFGFGGGGRRGGGGAGFGLGLLLGKLLT